jgi:hypothetical protein
LAFDAKSRRAVPPVVPVTPSPKDASKQLLVGCVLAVLIIIAIGTLAGFVLDGWLESMNAYHGFKPAVAQGIEVDSGVARAMEEAEGIGFVSEVRFSGMHSSQIDLAPKWHVVYETSLRSRARPSFVITRTIDVSSFLGVPEDGYEVATLTWEDYQAVEVLNQMDSIQRVGFIELFEKLVSNPNEQYYSLRLLSEVDDPYWNARVSLDSVRDGAAARGELGATWLLTTRNEASPYYTPYRILYYSPARGWILREEILR